MRPGESATPTAPQPVPGLARRLHRVVRVIGAKADVEDAAGRTQRVSLKALDGPAVSRGDWLVICDGRAVDRVTNADGVALAEELRRAVAAAYRAPR